MEADEAHSFVMDLVFDHVCDFIGDLTVSSVTPPDEYIGVVQYLLGDALIGFV